MDKPERCETPGRPYLVGKDAAAKKAIVMRPNCNLWTCPYCGPAKATAWALTGWHGAQKLMEDGYTLSFITITSRGGEGRTRDRALSAFGVAWPKLRQRAKYASGGMFEYLLVPEQHQNGIIHAHLIATNTLNQRWWKDTAFECGLGYMSKVRNIDEPIYASFYVTKYLSKDLLTVQWPKGFRRVRTSQGWPQIEQPGQPENFEYEVFFERGALNWEIYLLIDLGYDVKVTEGVKSYAKG
jgi:hypothetical protein